MIDLEQVRSTVAAALGQGVTDVRRVPGSVANQDVVVRLADGSQVVLKAAPPTELAAEAWACRHLRTVGVPVPEILAVDLGGSGLGRPFLIMGFVPGSPSEDPEVAREAGRWFRTVHAIELPGWGPLLIDGADVSGRHASWSDAIAEQLSGVDELVHAGILDVDLAHAARTAVEVEAVLGYAGRGVLLHHDLKPAHLFGPEVDGATRLSAVIDWGDATVGDPVADLARLSMAGPEVTHAFLDGYGVRLDDGLADRLARHRIAWDLGSLTYEYRAGGDWFDVYRDRIRQDTTLVSCPLRQ